MTQNIYDDPEFFARYSRLERSRVGLAGMDEWPALHAMLPSLKDKTVLDLGCGDGIFCRWAAGEGAKKVLGLDVSENMLARARAAQEAEGITYEHCDLESLVLPETEFDLAFSSLVFHYIADLGKLFTTVFRALKQGGRLVFSVEHPIFMAPRRPEWLMEAGRPRTWPVDNYSMEGPRETLWFVPGVIKQHRTMATMINTLLQSGFAIAEVVEWRPSDEQVAKRPGLALELERPRFLMISAVRP